MAHKIGDRIKEQANTSGTGSFGLGGAMPGFLAFASKLAVGDTTWYCAVNGSEWEVGYGTLVSAGSFARTTVLGSSNAGALVNFSAAPVVFCTIAAQGVDTIAFAVSRAADQTGFAAGGGSLSIVFDTVEFDTHGVYNVSTGKVTIPRAGLWRFDWGLNIAGTPISSAIARLMKNATAPNTPLSAIVGESDGIQNTTNYTGNGITLTRPTNSRLFNLAVGDVLNIEARVFGTDPIKITGQTDVNFFCGQYLRPL